MIKKNTEKRKISRINEEGKMVEVKYLLLKEKLAFLVKNNKR